MLSRISQNGSDNSSVSPQGYDDLSEQSNPQAHLNDYTKNQPPPRKQNTACDACRSRKVKCNRIPGQDKCQHCLSKNYPCTHYVQQATSEKKRAQTLNRRPRNLSGASKYPPSVMDASGQKAAILGRFASPPSPHGSSPATMPPVSCVLENGAASHAAPVNGHLPLPVRYGFTPNITLQTTTRELLSYIFAPPDITEDQQPFLGAHVQPSSPYDAWGDEGHKLEGDRFKAEFTLDLVEVYFQIVHTRIPLLNRDSFKARLELGASLSVPSQSQSPPLHPALVATVLAWGTKFSEHPVLQADRKRHNGQSILAKTLINRAQSLAEALKVHRIPNQEHIVIALLIEPLQSQIADDPTGFRGFWLTAATRHLLDLQLNHKSTLNMIQNHELKSTMIFAWWMACICDAYASAYYRRKPVLTDGDYDIDFYTAYDVDANTVVEMQGGPTFSPREHLQILGWYNAAHSLARTARRMSEFWKPDTDTKGIPYDVAVSFTEELDSWRDEFLSTVGVPSNFKGDWDFVSAVSACASDATYHVMWIILFNALDDFGFKELNDRSLPPEDQNVTRLKRKVVDEAMKGATRIAGLASVLTLNGYLKLDPAVMHISCIHAGTMLARLGRPEVKNCIEGLEQYSYSYEEAGEQAREMSRTYQAALAGEPQFTYMGMSLPGSPPPQTEANSDVEMKTEYGQPSSTNYQDHQYATYG